MTHRICLLVVVVGLSISTACADDDGTTAAPTADNEVDDTTAALQALAHAVRIESGTKVVAITGSAGKTTTKEITAEFLAARYRVVRNRGNLNNHIGLPLSLMVSCRSGDEAMALRIGWALENVTDWQKKAPAL